MPEELFKIPTGLEMHKASQAKMLEIKLGKERFSESYFRLYEMPNWLKTFVTQIEALPYATFQDMAKNYTERRCEEVLEEEGDMSDGYISYKKSLENEDYGCPFSVSDLLYEAIRQQKLGLVQNICAYPEVTAEMLNISRQPLNEGGDKVSHLYCATTQTIEKPKLDGDSYVWCAQKYTLVDVQAAVTNALATKIAIVDALLDAGAKNVNHGYYVFGTSGLTPVTALCYPDLWPGITEEEHLRLLQRMRDYGARPHIKLQPLAKSPYEIASEHASHLLALLPDNEDDDGQITIEPIPVIREKRATEVARLMQESLNNGTMFSNLD